MELTATNRSKGSSKHECEVQDRRKDNRIYGLYAVLKVYNLGGSLQQWLSWLERRPVTAKVVGSSPIWVVYGS